MGKIGMILYDYPLGVSPSLISSAILLAREGYEVHLFVDKSIFCANRVDFDDSRIIVHAIGESSEKQQANLKKQSVFPLLFRKNIGRALYWTLYILLVRLTIIPLPFSKKLYYYCRYIFRDFFRFYQNILEYIDNEYISLIGVDHKCLVIATLISIKKKIPVIYFNLELLLGKECKHPQQKILKFLERESNRRSYMTIIQDERRAKYLMEDNNVPLEKLVYVPVSTLGEPYESKSDYLHRTLDIGKDKKIILYAGNVVPWSMSLEIAEAAQEWDDNKVLVLHTWRSDLADDPYIDKLRSLTKNEKVYLSLNPVEWESLPELLSSADIGLIFYQNLGANFYETGSSSNKLAQYVQVGLPLITSDYPSFKEVIPKYKCGKCAKSPAEIETYADEIFSDYDSYRRNAFRCYQEKYEFSKYFKAVIKMIYDLHSSNEMPIP
ncbi:hypothetical protein ACFLTS_02010 [Chloroflexota bacterium]